MTTPAAVSDNVDQRKDPHRCAGLVKVAPVFLSIFLANLDPETAAYSRSYHFVTLNALGVREIWRRLGEGLEMGW